MVGARKENGAVIVEFALVLVPLLLLVVGLLQFGLLLNAKIDQTHLTREAARYASVNQNPGGAGQSLQDYILAQADTGDLRANATLCVTFPTNDETLTAGQVGDPVTFTMSYAYDLLPFLGDRLGLDAPFTVPVETHATMRLEASPDDIAAGCSS